MILVFHVTPKLESSSINIYRILRVFEIIFNFFHVLKTSLLTLVRLEWICYGLAHLLLNS